MLSIVTVILTRFVMFVSLGTILLRIKNRVLLILNTVKSMLIVSVASVRQVGMRPLMVWPALLISPTVMNMKMPHVLIVLPTTFPQLTKQNAFPPSSQSQAALPNAMTNAQPATLPITSLTMALHAGPTLTTVTTTDNSSVTIVLTDITSLVTKSPALLILPTVRLMMMLYVWLVRIPGILQMIKRVVWLILITVPSIMIYCVRNVCLRIIHQTTTKPATHTLPIAQRTWTTTATNVKTVTIHLQITRFAMITLLTAITTHKQNVRTVWPLITNLLTKCTATKTLSTVLPMLIKSVRNVRVDFTDLQITKHVSRTLVTALTTLTLNAVHANLVSTTQAIVWHVIPTFKTAKRTTKPIATVVWMAIILLTTSSHVSLTLITLVLKIVRQKLIWNVTHVSWGTIVLKMGRLVLLTFSIVITVMMTVCVWNVFQGTIFLVHRFCATRILPIVMIT